LAFAPYATLDEFKAWLTPAGSNEHDLAIVAVLDAVSRWIDEYCQRHFWQDGTEAGPVARTFEARSCRELRLGEFNDLSSVGTPTVETDEAGDGTFETVWSPGEFQLWPTSRPTGRPYTAIRALTRQFPYAWPYGARSDRIRVTGVWGWDAVPDSVHQACLVQASRVFKRREAPEGVVGFDQFGTIRISNRPDPDVAALLDPYRRGPVLVA
jgi:hypothetical protein